VSKGIKKALKNMPKAERQMVAHGLQGGGRNNIVWSKNMLAKTRALNVEKRQGVADNAPGVDTSHSARTGQSALSVFVRPNQRYLIVGDGNFSFSAGLVSLLQGNGSPVTATVYDSREVVKSKYSDAPKHAAALQASGAVIHYEMDGTALENDSRLDPPYDCVIFNFPHVGLSIQDQEKNILANQALVTGFLESAACVCHDTSTICITTKKGEPYESWKVARLGIGLPDIRLRLKTAVDFEASAFPGFAHRRTAGYSEKEEALVEDNGLISSGAKTFVFQLEKGSGGPKKPAEGPGAGRREKESIKTRKKKHGSKMGKGGVVRGPVAKGSRGPKPVWTKPKCD